MKIRIADLNVEIQNRYPFTVHHCAEYLAEFDTPDLTVAVSEAEIDREIETSPHKVSRGYAEFVCLYRAIVLLLPRFDAFFLHAAVVELDGKAYAFSAASGTGKSTHVALWLKVFGERARVINGDKPIFRFINGKLMAFGTPWCGKEGLACNAASPLEAICFLERSAENSIREIDDADAVRRLFSQILLPKEAGDMVLLLSLLDRMIGETPTYLLGCNMEDEAALVAYHGMKKESKI